ncbi:hypothetical protein [Diaphorobacter nitroreducens]|uniref:hypothetical protein n=1 Tax=Diaphorobacter nitroreducens TaxID=164759 RepID=UPI0024E238D6|nr:hypothetical protein [Diaphorobacter nitroreducens]
MENNNLALASYNWAIDRCINNAWSIAEPLLEYAFDTPAELYSRISFCVSYCSYDELEALIEYESGEELALVKPEKVSDIVWGIFSEDARENQIDLRIRLRLVIFLLELSNANFHLRFGTEYRAIDSLGDAMLALGEARALFKTQPEAIARSEFAKTGAIARLKNDPKQAAKQDVRDCWERWQKNRHEYKSKSAFAKAMLDKYESLENQRVIERWCKEWESEPS